MAGETGKEMKVTNLTGNIHKQIALKLANEAAILKAMPGTRREIEATTGIKSGTLQGRLLAMVRDGRVVVVSRGRGGKTWTESTYDVADHVELGREWLPIKAPVTQYHTRWIGGGYPVGRSA